MCFALLGLRSARLFCQLHQRVQIPIVSCFTLFSSECAKLDCIFCCVDQFWEICTSLALFTLLYLYFGRALSILHAWDSCISLVFVCGTRPCQRDVCVRYLCGSSFLFALWTQLKGTSAVLYLVFSFEGAVSLIRISSSLSSSVIILILFGTRLKSQSSQYRSVWITIFFRAYMILTLPIGLIWCAYLSIIVTNSDARVPYCFTSALCNVIASQFEEGDSSISFPEN